MATINVLGPLEIIDDSTSTVGPRDRVVLAALASRPGRAITADALSEALWGATPPASSAKVVQGCIARLRKRLGAEAIETMANGYRLVSDVIDVDIQRFEESLARGRELLELGQHDRAETALREASEIWHGPALVDVADWDPARIEAERLHALQAEGDELLIEASLLAGRPREVLAAAKRLVAEQPLRERRWALLARSEYQDGRQAEALRTLRRARATLATEAGLDIGPDLVALEEAILQQDPTLSIPSEPVAATDDAGCPYPGLVAYDMADRDGFFGREEEVAACVHRLRAEGFLAVVGPSGSGKSSLLRAGVAATLASSGRPLHAVTPGRRPLDTLSAIERQSTATVIVVDQLEEAVTLCDDEGVRTEFFDGLAALALTHDVAVAIRADRLGEISAYRAMARHLERGMFLLGAMTADGLRAAIEGPARQAGLLLEPGLAEVLLRDSEGQPGALPLLSHALRQTWRHREGRTLTVTGYNRSGGLTDAVARSAESLFTSLPPDRQSLARDLLTRLVVLSDDQEPVRSPVPVRALDGEANRTEIVRLMADARLVTNDGDRIQLAHEALTTAWPRFRTWLDEDVDGQRIRRHLILATDEWDRLGRADSELYRGRRLAAALDWQDRNPEGVTGQEATFLESSRQLAEREDRTAEQRAADQARRNRQLRLLLAGASILLVVAVIAGMLLVGANERANAATVRADARRVGAQALVAEDVDRSLLLAVEGVRLDDASDTRDSLRAALARQPLLIGTGRADGPAWYIDVTPDAGRLFVSGRGALIGYDVERLTPVADAGFGALSIEVSPDGRLVAASDDDRFALFEHDRDPFPVRLFDAETLEPGPDLADLPYDAVAVSTDFSADGRRLAAGFQHLDYEAGRLAFSSIRIWDVDAPDRQPLIIELPAADGAVEAAALSGDGSRVFVATSGPPSSSLFAFDVGSGDVAASAPIETGLGPNSALAVDPDGEVLAVAEELDVVLRATDDLSEIRRLEGHEGVIFTVAYAHDGTMVATASEDGTVKVWDASTGALVHDLTGHSGPARGAAFSQDDRTLFTSGLDGAILSWDLHGRRRFAPLLATADFVALTSQSAYLVTEMVSPDGKTAAFLQVREGEDGQAAGVQLLDIESGIMSPWRPTSHGEFGDGAWDPTSTRFATTGGDGVITVWDAATWTPIISDTVADGHIAAVNFTGDGTRILFGERSGRMATLDADTLAPVGRPVVAPSTVEWMAAGPGSLAAGQLVGGLILVDLERGEVLFEEPGLGVWGSALSPDGTRLAVGTSSGEVGLLDIERREWVVPPTERTVHRAGIGRINFSPDGSRYVTGSRDGRIGVFDASTGLPTIAFPDLFGAWSMPYFEPDGQAVRVVAIEGPIPGVYRWDLDLDREIERACATAGRNLDDEEWTTAFGDRPYRETCAAN